MDGQNRQLSQIILFLLALMGISGCRANDRVADFGEFNGGRAYIDVINQVEIGPRYPGTKGHADILDYMVMELELAGWQVERHDAEFNAKNVINLIAFRDERAEYILVGAHYDSRILADRDLDEKNRNEPVPGANDGGSGVAVLLELARTLPKDLPVSTRLVFFDAEDNGGIDDWDWILGSRAYVRDIRPLPIAVVILDMIGDADLQVYYERNSDLRIREEIWRVADDLGYKEAFIQQERHSMLDDHIPFLEVGIPAVNLIDFDYPHWHTLEDTPDKVSPQSLQVIGDTITAWLVGQ